jgi:acyl-CoA synthetase (AMP-forming)/AMP-acid ligase II
MGGLVVTRLVSRATRLCTGARILFEGGLLRPPRPGVALRGVLAIARHGLSPAAAYEYSAARFGGEVAVVDDVETVTFAELTKRIDALTTGFENAGIEGHDRVGVLCRNHHEFVEAVAALSGLGADVVLLNVSHAAPQLAAISAAEGLTALVHDEEFAPQAQAAAKTLKRFVTSCSHGETPEARVDELDRGQPSRASLAPLSPSRYVLLTSGTTRAPKGTARGVPLSVDPLLAMLSRVPLRSRDVTLIASPLFHAWGFGQLGLAMVMSSTVVLQRRFDPESLLSAAAEHKARVLVVVPYMLQRLLEVPTRVRRRFDLSSLEIVMSSGSPLSGGLGKRFMDAYGEILYNVYGSTEAAWGAIATPTDLRDSPGTVGIAPLGTELLAVDSQGQEVEPHGVGRILVKNELMSPSYSGGSQRTEVGGFLPTGDLGHFDEQGRLHIDGREDEMIISGGENIYPQEIEQLLSSHPAISEAMVVGVPDDRYGQALRAVVVVKKRHLLTKGEIQQFVKEHLARYKAPRDVEFVEELPRNETGKLLRSCSSENVPLRRRDGDARDRRDRDSVRGTRAPHGSPRVAHHP